MVELPPPSPPPRPSPPKFYIDVPFFADEPFNVLFLKDVIKNVHDNQQAKSRAS